MVKVRPRKTTKASWTMDQLEKAVKLIDEEGYTMRKAALAMKIQFSSLHKRYKKTNKKTPVLKTRQGRKKQHATILTSTPLNVFLAEKENKKKAKAEKVKGKGIGKRSKPTALPKTAAAKVKKRILRESNESSSTSEVKTDDLCKDDIEDDAEDLKNQCLVCGEFGRNNEMWFRCTSCGLWAHSECTGWNLPVIMCVTCVDPHYQHADHH